MTPPIKKQIATEKTMSLRSVSTASSILPAPSSWPTMMPTALPIARKATLKTLAMVEAMLQAVTTS